jgi:hypothetical protein
MYNPSPAKLKQLIVLLSSFLACLFFGVLGYDVFKDGIPLLNNASRIISSVSSHKHRSPKLDPPAHRMPHSDLPRRHNYTTAHRLVRSTQLKAKEPGDVR